MEVGWTCTRYSSDPSDPTEEAESEELVEKRLIADDMEDTDDLEEVDDPEEVEDLVDVDMIDGERDLFLSRNGSGSNGGFVGD